MIETSSCDKCGAVRTRKIVCDAEGCGKVCPEDGFVVATLTLDFGDGESVKSEFCKSCAEKIRQAIPHHAKHYFSSI